MRKISTITSIFLFFLQYYIYNPLRAQPLDTIYMNAIWQISEKPFAHYYRFGKVVIDTFWYYKGQIQDYYIDGTLQMEGNYSDIGEKHGEFSFFHPNGMLSAKGYYSYNHRKGVWEYYYRNGNLRARISYPGEDKDFSVLEFRDSTGIVLLQNGSGKFEWRVSIPDGLITYRLEGEYTGGKKSGTWNYYSFIPVENKESLAISEIYENGLIKKRNIFSPYTGIQNTYRKPAPLLIPVEYNKLRETEYFSKDRTCFTNRKDDQDLKDYLLKRQAPSYNVEGESFEESFFGILTKLNTPTILRYFRQQGKIYDGYVSINMSDSGDIEEIEITGNLSNKEKEYMLFFFKKFRNIQEIVVENVSIDAYHKVYFYTVTFAEFIPKKYLDSFPDTLFLFALMPYDKLKEVIVEAIKNKRKKKKEVED